MLPIRTCILNIKYWSGIKRYKSKTKDRWSWINKLWSVKNVQNVKGILLVQIDFIDFMTWDVLWFISLN